MAGLKMPCSVVGCNNLSRTKGLCQAHYLRKMRYGDPLAGGTPWGAAKRFLEEVVYPHKGDGCLIWPFAEVHGYGVIRMGGKNERVSRLACQQRNGPPPTDRSEAAHSCGRGHEGCVAPGHLRWATRVENRADMVEHGSRPQGESHGLAKLTEETVREIRALKGTASQSRIAERFGISREHVRDLHNRKRWGWLGP